jgi:hypothetical protein
MLNYLSGLGYGDKDNWADLHFLRDQLSTWLDEVHRVAYWLAPFLPDTGKKIIDILSAVPITASVPLFPRLTGGITK